MNNIAIQTRCIAATETTGTRIRARTKDGHEITIGFDHKLSGMRVHYEAVRDLVAAYDLDWDLTGLRYGETSDGYVFVFADSVVDF